MAKPTVTSDYRVRDLMIARLIALRPALEAKGVSHAFLFGSVSRGDDVPESDVDILVDLDPVCNVGIFEFSGIADFLKDALRRPVDLVTRGGLTPGRHDRILSDLHEVF